MRAPAAFALAAMVAAGPARAAAVPDWLTEASRRSSSHVSSRTSAVVLHDEQIVEVPSRGRTVVTTRWAVRVLSREGRSAASASVGYARGTSEVRRFNLWTLGPDGRVLRRWERKQAADISDLDVGQLYTDLRHLAVTDDAIEPGQTFAWESVTEEEPLFAQWRWWFRGGHPCALSRFELRLPSALEVVVRTAHLDLARVGREPERWSWELRDLPARPSVRTSDPICASRRSRPPVTVHRPASASATGRRLRAGPASWRRPRASSPRRSPRWPERW